jgi:hypothetical protein
MRCMQSFLLAAAFAVCSILAAAPGFAQQAGKGRQEARPASNMSHEDRQRLRQDVDAARGNYNRREVRRGERMGPVDREKLRRDVLDANRDMRKR